MSFPQRRRHWVLELRLCLFPRVGFASPDKVSEHVQVTSPMMYILTSHSNEVKQKCSGWKRSLRITLDSDQVDRLCFVTVQA